VKRYICSKIYNGIIVAPGAILKFCDLYLDLSPFFGKTKTMIPYEEIRKVIYTPHYFFFKVFYKNQYSLTFLSWRVKTIVKLFLEKGVSCESHEKKIHNPTVSNYFFWHFR